MNRLDYNELYKMWSENAPKTSDKVALNEDWGMFVDSLVRAGRVSELMWKYLPNTDEIPEDTQKYLEAYTGSWVCPETFEEIIHSDGHVVTQVTCGVCDHEYTNDGDITDCVVRCPRCNTLNYVDGP